MHVYNEGPMRELREAVEAVQQALDIRDSRARCAAFTEAAKKLERAVEATIRIDPTL